MSRLPYELYRAAQVREIEQQAITAEGIPGYTLMQRAGEAAFALLRRRWPTARRIALFCGTGNNGGDASVVARLAHGAGLEVVLFQVGDGGRLRGDALTARDAACTAGVAYAPFDGQDLRGYDLVVDGLLGTGVNGEIKSVWAEAIGRINASACPVLALDIPSGLAADTGATAGAVVCASATITFVVPKPGLLSGRGPEVCGYLAFADLGVTVADGFVPAARRLAVEPLRQRLHRRPRSAHKGRFGHVLVVGGELGMSGAARLAAEAAARGGAGLVSVATRAAHAPLLNIDRPELMCHGAERPDELAPLLRRASVVVIGPGLGRGDWGQAMLGRVLDSELPLVVDADALNLLAEEPVWRREWVLTPHPGEAARMLGQTTAEVEADRFLAAAEIVGSYGGVCVLKGAGSLVCDGMAPTDVCAHGNPGMASGGMGDVLSGVIGALLAQGMAPAEAARLGVCVHGAAGDAAASDGERGMLASDLFPHLRRLLNPDND